MQEYTLKTGHLIVIAAREKATVSKMQDVKRDVQSALMRLSMIVPDEGETSRHD